MHNVPYILDDEEINIGKGIFKGEGGGKGAKSWIQSQNPCPTSLYNSYELNWVCNM